MSHNKPDASSCLAALQPSPARWPPWPLWSAAGSAPGEAHRLGAVSGLGVSRGSAPPEPAMLPD